MTRRRSFTTTALLGSALLAMSILCAPISAYAVTEAVPETVAPKVGLLRVLTMGGFAPRLTVIEVRRDVLTEIEQAEFDAIVAKSKFFEQPDEFPRHGVVMDGLSTEVSALSTNQARTLRYDQGQSVPEEVSALTSWVERHPQAITRTGSPGVKNDPESGDGDGGPGEPTRRR